MDFNISPELFLDFRSGDSKAEERVFKFYCQEITYFAEELIKNETEADNIITSAWVELLKNRKLIATREELDAYLYRSVSEYCNWYLISNRLATIEHFMTPSVWRGELDFKNPISRAKVRAKALADVYRDRHQLSPKVKS